MDTVTYPDLRVVELVQAEFAPVNIDMLARHADFREASGPSKAIWAPLLRFEDAKGRELRRWTGWLPPEVFLAELRFVRATAAFQNAQFEVARDGFSAVVAEFPGTSIFAEALYWQGITGFLAGNRDMGALREAWTRLARDHGDTRWGQHASVIEDAPSE